MLFSLVFDETRAVLEILFVTIPNALCPHTGLALQYFFLNRVALFCMLNIATGASFCLLNKATLNHSILINYWSIIWFSCNYVCVDSMQLSNPISGTLTYNAQFIIIFIFDFAELNIWTNVVLRKCKLSATFRCLH